MKKLRELIINSGEKLIDAALIISLIFVFLFALGLSIQSSNFIEGLFIFILLLFGGLIYLVFAFFFIYLLIDIRELLKEIKDNTKECGKDTQ